MNLEVQLSAIETHLERLREHLDEPSARPETDGLALAAKKNARVFELMGQSVYAAMQRGHVQHRHVYEWLDNFLWNDHERLLFGLQIMGDSPVRESRKPIIPV